MDKKIKDIIILDRVRKDYGDIEQLAQSISNIGLLQPVGISPNNELLFGERRIKAFELLGYTCIECVVIDLKCFLYHILNSP